MTNKDIESMATLFQIIIFIVFLPFVVLFYAIKIIIQIIKFIYEKSITTQDKNKKLALDDKANFHIQTKVRQSNDVVEFTFFEKRYIDYVKSHSQMFQRILSLNNSCDFEKVNIQKYSEQCSSLRSYNNIDERRYLRDKIKNNIYFIESEIIKAESNLRKWENYFKEYKNNEIYLRKDEIEKLPDRKVWISTFKKIERKLYASSLKQKPTCSLTMSASISYTSPQGRNSYYKEARLTHYEIKEMLIDVKMEIEREEKEKSYLLEQKRKQKLAKDTDKLLQDEERQLLREKRERERREILEYRERVRAEERLIKAEYTASKNKRIYDKLQKQKEALDKREQEFQLATQGHIYSLPTSLPSKTSEEEVVEESDESLSAWEKMKLLKKSYENGEITYNEYNEKRKHLL